uniref:Uncharacterized protein n=1 Tax=Opuntia streptacantha TaxID=393608 RepID=A0A7C8YAX0_OPUST
MEARAGVVVEGGQRALSSAHSSVVDGSSSPRILFQQSQSQMGTVSQLLAGGVAGAVSKTCTAPLARLTILFQVQGMHADVAALNKTGVWHEASRIINEEGLRAFWKGNLVTIVHRLPYSSINFYAYEHYKKRNVMYYRGMWHALETICKEEGFPGLYKGLQATLVGVGPSIAISFSVYETLRSYWQCQRPHDSTVGVSLTCGSLSGIASSTATFPLDLVRRRMQLQGAGGQAHVYRTGILGTFGHIFQTEGLRGFYRGILPEYYKVT